MPGVNSIRTSSNCSLNLTIPTISTVGSAARWLDKLKSPESGGLWRLQSMFDEGPKDSTAVLFQEKLLDNMHDAVVFVDRNCKILLWNRGRSG